ncbi:MAG: peptide chain release factor 1 [Candidatus Lokiarchaeota archaeon]|nr:peptide chain release factor 1 [Candidatus Lokiarchaeota archaeon]
MIERLKRITETYHSLQSKLADTTLIRDQVQYRKTARELKELEPIVERYEEYKRCLEKIAECDEVLAVAEEDESFRQLAHEEKSAEESRRDTLMDEIRTLLVPKDPDDGRNAIVEIRAGTGGDESTLFAADLFRMYSRFAEKKRYRLEIGTLSPSELRGIREVVCIISGAGAYADFKFEKGTHRVQRVPETESSGRIHTSAVTVAVFPEVEETDVVLNENDLRIETFRASGAGGQHVNKTESAVRITHLPSSLTVVCQDEKSQHKNKAKALKVLRSRLYDQVRSQKKSEIDRDRRKQVGSGDRSEKIRTYNFPQSRVTDHRIQRTSHSLEFFLEGDMDEMIEALKLDEREQKLTQS